MKLPLFFLISLLLSCASKEVDHSDKSINAKLVAVEGYDIVSYHVDSEAKHGKSQINSQIGDVFYYFSSVENMKLFDQDPKKYLPKYGGFCAIGIALYDGKFDIDPEDFLIDDGELYLFCPDQLDNWKEDQENLKKLADEKWVEMEAALENGSEKE